MELTNIALPEEMVSSLKQIEVKHVPKVQEVSPVPLKEWFIKGPIPGPWIAKAASLPGHSLHVALAIRYLHGCTGKSIVTLTRKEFDKIFVKKNSTHRALDFLSQAGLILYRREGHKVRVKILDFHADAEQLNSEENN